MSLPKRLPNGRYGKGRKVTTVMAQDDITWTVRDERGVGYIEVSSDTETIRFYGRGRSVDLTIGRAEAICPDPKAHEKKRHWWSR